MTNKKFKVAAMSMALTACVAAQPLIANAADENINSTDANVNESQSEGESPASAPVAAASVSSDPVTNKHDEGAVDVIGDPDISVDYNHDNDKVTKDDSSTTTESTGPVNRDVPKESEPGAQQPSGDGQQGGNHETDLNNEQKGEPETDLNNEQEGSKDGGSETEKTPIGEAEKTETETKDTKLVLGEPTTTTTTTTNPDGSTTTTTTTTTDAALETTTKVEGEASAKTEEDSSEDVKKESLKEELDGKDLSWDTEPKTKFGDYTVTDAVEEEDGSKTFTLTKEDKIETGEMTGIDISKLIEAGYTDNGDGTYTLTKEYTDSQGQKHTTTVKVDSSKATKTTSTKLTVRMASQEHEKTEELGTKEDTNYPYPSTDITVKDDKGKEHTFNVTYILGKAHENKDGTFTYEDKENNLTYTITKNETNTKLDSLTDTELRDLLNDHAGSEKYTLDNEGNLCYITDKGEKCRVTDEQNTLLRSVLKLGITITDHHGKESDTQKVENSEKTPEQAKADAEKTAQDEALKDALAQAINKETGKSLTKADITLPEVRDGKFEWTDTATRKTYTFSYTEKGTVSSFEEIKDPTTVDKNASSAEKNTETGSAEVTGSTVIWTKKDQTIVQNDTKTDTTFGAGFDFKHIPDGFELDGDAVYNNDGTLQSFKTKDGKTYEFTYAPGSAPDTLTDISNADFTKVTWKTTQKTTVPVTSPDDSSPTQIEIERNFQKTEDNGTFTFTETKKDGKTYSGLKKVAGEDNLYRNDDGSVTIRVTPSTLGVDEVKAALEGKGYKDVKERSAVAKFKAKGEEAYFLAWTTTPWTLPSNVALCVNPAEDYVKIKVEDGTVYYMAQALVEKFFPEGVETLATFKGKELEYREYEPLFECTKSNDGKKGWYVTCDGYVTLTDGTGIVHIAPAFGEDDANVGKNYDLPFVQLVDAAGCMDKSTPWAGKFCKDADRDVLVDLDKRGLLFSAPVFEHSYPHCWRCDTPLIYYARDSWFIKMTAVRDDLVRNNNTVNWIPESIGKGRFGDWIENVQDWSISRNRYWGTPLNVWECECGHRHSIGSIEELKSISSKCPEDIEQPRNYNDAVTLK